MDRLETLEADLNANTDATNSVVSLVQTLRQEILDAGVDPVKLKTLTDKLEANTATLAAAAVNTSGQPPA